MKGAWFFLGLMVAVGSFGVLMACGGGGSEQEQPTPHPPANCSAKPEACK